MIVLFLWCATIIKQFSSLFSLYGQFRHFTSTFKIYDFYLITNMHFSKVSYNTQNMEEPGTAHNTC